MAYFSSGSLTTDSREVSVSETWDTQSDWEANQNQSNVTIENGTISLSETLLPTQDLFAHYDATQLSQSNGTSVGVWSDETDNGNDLTAGNDPTFQTSVINGNDVVRFDGSGNYLEVTFSTSQSSPTHVFIVSAKRSTGSSAFYQFDGDSSNSQAFFANNGNFSIAANSVLNGPSIDTSPHIHTGLFSSSGNYRIDGTTQATGDSSNSSFGGITLGCRADQANFGDYDIGEVLVYGADMSSSISDIEDYLSGKWGITV